MAQVVKLKNGGMKMASHVRCECSGGNRCGTLLTSKKAKQIALAAVIAAMPILFTVPVARAASVTWDSSGTSPASPVDGPGSWDAASTFWSNPTASTSADTTWNNGNNDTAVFGSNNGAADIVTIGATGITAGGVTFNPAGSGSYTIAGTAPNTLILAGSTPTITSNVSGTISAPISLNGNLIVTDGGAAVTTTLSGLISDGANGASSITMNGTGVLALSTLGNTYSGGLTVNSGTVALAIHGTAGTGVITLNGGTLSVAGSGTSNLTNLLNIPAGASPTITGIGTEEFGGNVSGSGTLNLNFTAGQFNITNRADFANFTGLIELGNSTSNGTTTTLRVSQGNKTGSFGGGIDLGNANGSFNTKVGGTYTIGSLAGGSQTTLQGASTASDTSMYSIGSLGLSTTFNGQIQDGSATGTATSLVVTGGSLTLTNANPYTGNTTISGGALILANTSGSATGAGNVSLTGGTLGGAGSIAGSVAAGAAAQTIHPGAVGGVGGTLSIGGNLTTTANTTLAFDLNSPGGSNSALAVAGNVILNAGTITVPSQATGATSLGYYKILTYSGTLTGSTTGILLPASVNNIVYTLDVTHNANAVEIHRGFIGDANDDGKVDLNDLNVVLNNLGTTNSSWSTGNFDGATTIDLTDLNDVLNHLGTSISSADGVMTAADATGSGSLAVAPEPASLGLLVLGATGLVIRRKK
jgi:fibronectin-binding autotransporter adhesin